MKRSLLCLLLGAFTLALPLVPARAEDESGGGSKDDPGYAYYEKRAKKILRTAGDKVWEAAEYAKRTNLFQFAIEQAERAIKFDPNHEDARKYLCFEKKGKKWQRDTEKWAKAARANSRASAPGKPPISIEALNERIEKWKEERLAKANRFVAAKYAVLANDCLKKGFPLQAKKGFEYALRLDKDCKSARKGLGYKKFGKVWLTKAADDARKKASVAKEFKEESQWDRFFEVTTKKVRSEHFRIESTYLEVAELLELAKTAEITYAYYLSDFGIDPTKNVFGSKRAAFFFMETDEQWHKYVDTYGGSHKELTKKMGGTGDHQGLNYASRKGNSNPASRKDSTAHRTAHMLNHKVHHVRQRAWLDEGMAYYYSIKVLETTLTHCVSLKEGKYAKQKRVGGIKDWKDHNNWKPNLKVLVQAKDDIPLRTLVNKTVAELEYEMTVKAWGLITWMMDTDRDRYHKFLDQHRSNYQNQIAILQGLFKKGLEEIDDDWHKFVIRNF